MEYMLAESSNFQEFTSYLALVPFMFGITVPVLAELVKNKYGPRVEQSVVDALRGPHIDYQYVLNTMSEKQARQLLVNGPKEIKDDNGEKHHIVFRALGLEEKKIHR